MCPLEGVHLRREPGGVFPGHLVHIHLCAHAGALRVGHVVHERAQAAVGVDAHGAVRAPVALVADAHSPHAAAPIIAAVQARGPGPDGVLALVAPVGGLACAHGRPLGVEFVCRDGGHCAGRVEPSGQLRHEDAPAVARPFGAALRGALLDDLQHAGGVEHGHQPPLLAVACDPPPGLLAVHVARRAVLEAHAAHEQVGGVALLRTLAGEREDGLRQAAGRALQSEAPHGRARRERWLAAAGALEVGRAAALAEGPVAGAVRPAAPWARLFHVPPCAPFLRRGAQGSWRRANSRNGHTARRCRLGPGRGHICQGGDLALRLDQLTAQVANLVLKGLYAPWLLVQHCLGAADLLVWDGLRHARRAAIRRWLRRPPH
mmetsp:Transcript_7152/g.24385  ORF Transcript_7152/g.24385 Transcript_7152/m.24385 type:complete len:375 (+) Transcript_7152:1153-2277(+)